MSETSSNIFDTALIFEGGGMRASYTCAVANVLLETGIYFDNVYGVSAGSSNAANYISRDIWRTRESFVEFVKDPNFGSWDTFLAHKGYFNAGYIYEESGKPNGNLPFDMSSFVDNPANITISGFRRDTGETVYWTREDMTSLKDLMRRVRASSSLPIFMPPPIVDGYSCYDGGLGEGAGLLLPRAKKDGFEKFFVVRTRKKKYHKKPGGTPMALAYLKRPFLRKALDTRSERYNAVLDELDQLEKDGKAYIFYAEDITADSATTDLAVLQQNYEAGYAQAKREVPAWLEFLGLDASQLSGTEWHEPVRIDEHYDSSDFDFGQDEDDTFLEDDYGDEEEDRQEVSENRD